MAEDGTPRRVSLFFPIILIAIGVIFLYANWHPAFDPWPIFRDYWPLILIFIGLGKIYDSWQRRQHPESQVRSSMGGTIAALALVVVLVVLLARGRRFEHWRGGSVYAMQHQSHTVDRQDAKTVRATLELGAGELNLSGNSSHLLESDFDYRSSSGAPKVDYSVSGT